MASTKPPSGRSPYEEVQGSRRARIIARVATMAFYFSIGLDVMVAALLLQLSSL